MSEEYEKIRKHAENFGLRIILVEHVPSSPAGSAGCYYHDEMEIFLKSSLSESKPYTWAILAHEIGHHVDITGRSQDYKNMVNVSYWTLQSCVNKGLKTPDEIGRFILGAEARAWDHAIDLVHRLEVPIPTVDLKKWKSNNRSAYKRLFKGSAPIRWKFKQDKQ